MAITETTETLIFKGKTVEEADSLRKEMIEKFAGCWFYVYNNAEIWVANEFGGRLNKSFLDQILIFTKSRSN